MLDITVAAQAVTAAELWTAPNDAAQLAADTPGAFSGLELVARLAGGSWPSIAAMVTDGREVAVPAKGVVCTDGQVCAIYVGRGRCVVPAGRRYAVVDIDRTRFTVLVQVPGVVYTSAAA